MIIVISASTIMDNTITKLSVYTGGLKSSNFSVFLFAFIVLVYGVGQYVILNYIGLSRQVWDMRMIVMYNFVVLTQYVLIGILITIILQMIITSSYSSVLIKAVIWLNYSVLVVFIGLLCMRFFSWFTSKQNKVLILYALAAAMICLNGIFTILYISNELSGQRGPEYIHPTRSSVGIVTNASNIFNSVYTVTSIMSFIMTWIATVFLLQNYSDKIGKAKYWMIVSIPLVFFLSQFQAILLDLFTPIRLSNPILFGIIYTLIFSATKPAGGILFGIAFWSVAKSINQEQVKRYMIISAFGLMLLYISNQPQLLTLNPYPPFGLATVCFVGLASYLTLVGVYSAALSVANDQELRRSIRRSAEQQANLLGNIGFAELEDQLQKIVLRKTRDLSEKITLETGVESSFEDNDIKNYVRMAINEIKERKKT